MHDGMYRAYLPIRAWRRPVATIQRQNMQSITVPNSARFGWRQHRRIIAWDDQRFIDPRYVPAGLARKPEPSSNDRNSDDDDEDDRSLPDGSDTPPVPSPTEVPPAPETTPSVDSPGAPPEPNPPPPVAGKRLDGPLLQPVNATRTD
ncbi:MAG TPA: hypothetical protein VHB77_17795 [Planctomycetaceae bacterium]|nr:hypothetical protein [Planctomycetaceae bacterium]